MRALSGGDGSGKMAVAGMWRKSQGTGGELESSREAAQGSRNDGTRCPGWGGGWEMGAFQAKWGLFP